MARRQARNPDFQTYMFKEDIERIKKWVLQYPDSETGGSLFGLWTSGGNPVVHIVLGPATGCTRTDICFFQNVEYLQRVGELLTSQYMLCHIGEWHSHHCMRLSHPSDGDVGTVVRNYPQGTCGFLLMIANIVSESAVTTSPYLFHERTSSYRTGRVVTLDGDSPFRREEKIQQSIELGAEQVLPPRRRTGLLDSIKDKVKDLKDFACTSNPFSAEKRGNEIPMDIDQDNERQKGRAGSPERRQTRRDMLTRPAINQQATVPRQPSNDRSPRRTVRALPQPTPQPVEASKCTEKHQWYSKKKGEKQLKTFFTCISSIPKTQGIEMTRDPRDQNLAITFIHHDDKWIINFPSDFPKRSANIKQEVSNTIGSSYTRFVDNICTDPAESGGEAKIREKITFNCTKCRTSFNTR